MYYLYDQKQLKVLRMDAEEAISVARFCDGILVTNKIEEAIEIASYSKSAFLIHSKNLYTLFSYWKLQLKYRTLREFRIILFAAPHKWLYFFLKFFALISFGAYRLIPLDHSSQKGSL